MIATNKPSASAQLDGKQKNKQGLLPWLTCGTLVVIAVCLSTVYYRATGHVIVSSDQVLYADLGRALSEGEGFVSRVIYPAYLPYLKSMAPTTPFPYFHQPLLLPMVESLFFRVLGPSKVGILTANITLLALAVILLYSVGRMISTFWVAGLGVLIFLVEPNTLGVTVGGLSEISLVVIVALTVLFIFRAGSSKGLAWMGMAGAVAAFIPLSRPAGIIYLLPLALLVWAESGRPRRVAGLGTFLGTFLGGLMIMGMVIPVSSFVPNLSGRLLYSTASFPGFSSYYNLVPGPLEAIGTYYPQIVKKYLWLFTANILQVWQFMNPAVVAGAALGVVLLPAATSRELAFRRFVGLAVVCTIGLNSIFASASRHLYPLTPWVALLFAQSAGAVVTRLAWSKRDWRPMAGAVILALVLGSPLAINVYRGWQKRGENLQMLETYRRFAHVVAAHTTKDEVIVSDFYPIIAWYGRRNVMAIPASEEVFREVHDRYIPVKTVVLTTYRTSNPYFDPSNFWTEVLEGRRALRPFVPVETFEENSFHGVVYQRKDSGG